VRAAVAGGTGVVGRLVVRQLEAAGHEPVVLSRGNGIDLTTGVGLDAALSGCGVAIDVTNVATQRARVAEGFFATVTTHLLDAAQRAGVGHVVALSIVGIDRVGLGYYAGKRRQEAVLAAGPVPWTVLRATQFHEFAGQLLARMRGPVVIAPVMLSRPVAAVEVATRLAELAVGPPQGMATPIAGPEALLLPDMLRQVCRARGSRRLVVPLRLPGAVGRALREGGLLPDGPCLVGRQRFADVARAGEVARPAHGRGGRRQVPGG
jgi:uncharacterized protein YbjT (DUF2867 family)